MDNREQDLDLKIKETLAAVFPEVNPPKALLTATIARTKTVQAGKEAEALLETHTREGPDTRSLLAVATVGRMTLAGMIPGVDYREAGRQLAQSREFANLVSGRSPTENLERIRSGTLIRELGTSMKRTSGENILKEPFGRDGPSRREPDPPEIKVPEKEAPSIRAPGEGPKI
jgi:hypothetical protein